MGQEFGQEAAKKKKKKAAGEALFTLAVAEFTGWRQWAGGPEGDGSLTCQWGGWRLGSVGATGWISYMAALGLKGCAPMSKVGTAWSLKAWPWKSHDDTSSHTPLVSVGTGPPSFRERNLALRSRTSQPYWMKKNTNTLIKVLCTEPGTYIFRIACFRTPSLRERNRSDCSSENRSETEESAPWYDPSSANRRGA